MRIVRERGYRGARIKSSVPIREILVEVLRELDIYWPEHANDDHRARVRRAVLDYSRRNRRAQ